ncbi:RICIN domain-containing protein [Streptacidiphilus melanogenes]|uniref:RICIN domain-containing protein n=1 Tax=Streptacidiphilus melanogenes TaxID=411235 RepID=UPI0005AA12F5|nr:RICIN domain-containing protein [Streptacidiphilus melanogenes]
MRSSFKTGLRALGLLAITASAVVAAPLVNPAQAAEGNLQIRLLTFAQKCVDVQGVNPADWTPLIQYACNGQGNQQFTLYPLGDGHVAIHTFAGKCVDVQGASTADFTPVMQYTCNGQANQEFTLVPAGFGTLEIHTFAGKCVDVQGAGINDWTPVIQYTCNGQANQHFTEMQ